MQVICDAVAGRGGCWTVYESLHSYARGRDLRDLASFRCGGGSPRSCARQRRVTAGVTERPNFARQYRKLINSAAQIADGLARKDSIDRSGFPLQRRSPQGCESPR